MKDIMLLESALIELSIDILDDYPPQMLLPVTTPAAQCTYSDAELEIRKTWSELLKSCSEPITTHEERENDSSTRDLEKYNVSRAPGCVPFTWEIQPGVPKSPQRELQIRDELDSEVKSITDFENILRLDGHERNHILGHDRHEQRQLLCRENQLSLVPFKLPLTVSSSTTSSHSSSQNFENILESNKHRRDYILESYRNGGNHIMRSDRYGLGQLLCPQENQPSPVLLKLPLTVSSGTTPSPASPTSTKKNTGGCFNWNLPHLSTQSINICEGSVQGGNTNGYDGDDEDDIIPSKLSLDSKEKWSPVSTLELPDSPRSSSSSSARLTPSFNDSHDTMSPGPAKATSTTLLWGVFPCKCIFLPLITHKGKKKQPQWATGHQDRHESKVSPTSQSIRLTSALKKKNSRSGSCNRNDCNSAAGMKQVRFSAETEAHFSSSNEGRGGETLPPPTQMDWASYGLF